MEIGLRPRPRICGKMNHIQCPILVPACNSESTRLNTESCAITKRSRLYGSWVERLPELCMQSSLLAESLHYRETGRIINHKGHKGTRRENLNGVCFVNLCVLSG